MNHQHPPPHGLSLWPSSSCLISELHAELKALSPEQLRGCHIVLPTKRLATWLMAMLAQERPAFIPPRCYTLDDFIERQAVDLASGPQPLRSMGDLEQELLLASLLKEGAYQHLRYGHEHEVKQLLSEFADWGMNLEAFDRLAEVVAQNIYLSEGSLDTLSQRLDELRHLATRFAQSVQDEHGAETSERRLARLSTSLASYLASQQPVPWRQLYVVGLSSAQGCHQALLHALARREDTCLWLSTVPELHTGKSPLEWLLTMIDAPGTLRQPTVVRATPQPLQVRRADTVLAEVAHALTLSQQALAGGVAPSGIAILVTNDVTYGKPLRAMLKGAQLAANVALATPLAETLPGTWLSSVIQLLLGDQTVARTLALLTHPLTLCWWRLMPEQANAEIAGTAGAVEWSSRLSRELCKGDGSESLQELTRAKHLSAEVRAYLSAVVTALGCWAERPLPHGRELADWVGVLSVLVQDFLSVDAAEQSQTKLDDPGGVGRGLMTSAAETLGEFCQALGALSLRLRTALTRREFLQILRDKLLLAPVRSVGHPLRGIQILSVAEARYVPFDVAFVLGASEGDFPRALPRDYLVDNYLKTKIGLPGWQLLEAIEDTTFHLLCARLPAMVLLYPANRGGDAVVRSRFIEAAIALGQTREYAVNADTEWTLLLAPQRHDRGQTAPAGHRLGNQGVVPNEQTERFLSHQSASSLAYLLACPYRFLLHRLGVHPVELPQEDDARHEGNWLHVVLEVFFTGRHKEQHLDAPLTFTGPKDTWAGQALARLNTLTDRLLPAAAADSPLELQVRQRAWPDFATHIAGIYGAAEVTGGSSGEREQRLVHADGTAVRLQVGDRSVVLTGTIDSVDQLAGLQLITDYKRRFVPRRSAVKEGLVPQLLLYAKALEQMHPERRLAHSVVGYWSILGGQWLNSIAGSEAQEQARRLKLVAGRDKTTLEDATQSLMNHWTSRHAALLAPLGSFTPEPRDCQMCHYAGVCRKDDPEFAPRMARSLRGANS